MSRHLAGIVDRESLSLTGSSTPRRRLRMTGEFDSRGGTGRSTGKTGQAAH